VSIVSKLDAVIDKESERWRRDAIFSGLGGVIVTILVIFQNSSFQSVETIILIFFAVSLYLSGIWSYLGYRRILELDTKSLNMPAGESFLSPEISQNNKTQNLNKEKTKRLATESDSQEIGISIYCPKCGVKNLENVPYCGTCGCSLELSPSPRGIERFLPAFLVEKLDNQITKYKEVTPYKRRWIILFVAAFFLLQAITSGLESDWVLMTIHLFVAVNALIIGGWDYIAYRRRLEKDKLSSDPSSESDNFLDNQPKLSNELKSFAKNHVGAVVFVIFVIVFGFILLSFGIASPLGPALTILGFIVGIALLLMFYKPYSKKRDEFWEEYNALRAIELQNENESEAEPAELVEETQRQLTPIDADSEIDSATESAPTRELVDSQGTETETKRLDDSSEKINDMNES